MTRRVDPLAAVVWISILGFLFAAAFAVGVAIHRVLT